MGTSCSLPDRLPPAERHAGSLRPLLSLLFDERHFCSELQVFEIDVIEHAIAVKIYFTVIGCFDETEIRFRKDPYDAAHRGLHMGLHDAPLLAAGPFKQPRRSVARVPYRYIGVRVLLAAYGQFLAGYGDVYTNAVDIALMVPALRLLHHHPAAHDPVVEPLQLVRFFNDFRFYGIGVRHVTKLD